MDKYGEELKTGDVIIFDEIGKPSQQHYVVAKIVSVSDNGTLDVDIINVERIAKPFRYELSVPTFNHVVGTATMAAKRGKFAYMGLYRYNKKDVEICLYSTHGTYYEGRFE